MYETARDLEAKASHHGLGTKIKKREDRIREVEKAGSYDPQLLEVQMYGEPSTQQVNLPHQFNLPNSEQKARALFHVLADATGVNFGAVCSIFRFEDGEPDIDRIATFVLNCMATDNNGQPFVCVQPNGKNIDAEGYVHKSQNGPRYLDDFAVEQVVPILEELGDYLDIDTGKDAKQLLAQWWSWILED